MALVCSLTVVQSRCLRFRVSLTLRIKCTFLEDVLGRSVQSAKRSDSADVHECTHKLQTKAPPVELESRLVVLVELRRAGKHSGGVGMAF